MKSSSALKNTFWLYGEKIITMGMLLVVNIIIARQLGPQGYGALNMLLAFVALFTPFVPLGLNAIITRELVNQEHSEGKVLGTSLLLRVIGMVLGSIVMLVLANYAIDSLKGYSILLMILIVGHSFTVLNLFDFWFQAHMASRYAASIRTIVMLVTSVAKAFVALYYADIELLVWVYALEWLMLGSGLAFFYFKRKMNTASWQVDWQYSGKLLKESGWLLLSGVASAIYLKIDQVMLGSMIGETAVGHYAVAVKLSEIWYFFPVAMAASFFPKLLASKKTDKSDYDSALQLLMDVMLIFSLFVVIAVISLSWLVIPVLFGDNYQSSVPLINVQIWACLFVFMRAVVSKWLLAESLVRYSLYSHGLGAVVNVALNGFWIPMYGAQGAAWATLIAYFVASYLCFWGFSDTRLIARKMTMAFTAPIRLKQTVNKLIKYL